eukprot:6830252-Pyramimonas_sp.AAC.1
MPARRPRRPLSLIVNCLAALRRTGRALRRFLRPPTLRRPAEELILVHVGVTVNLFCVVFGFRSE